MCVKERRVALCGSLFLIFIPMIALLSPAKSLDFEQEAPVRAGVAPALQEEAAQVMRKLATFDQAALRQLQSISADLAALNFERNQDWDSAHPRQVKSAVFAFNGDVYTGLEARNWSPEDLDYADRHLRILSGLYGLLKPSDKIQPYRLEMGTALELNGKKNLYEFWTKPLQTYFQEHIEADRPLINLASKEYFKALETAKLPNPVYEVDFKEKYPGGYRIVSFFAKKARGRMANYMVQNRLTDPQSLKDFNLDHYYFDAERSGEKHFVFLRDKK